MYGADWYKCMVFLWVWSCTNMHLHVCLCIYISVCMRIFMCTISVRMCERACVYTCAYEGACICGCESVCMQAYVWVWMSRCTSVNARIHVPMCVWMRMCVYGDARIITCIRWKTSNQPRPWSSKNPWGDSSWWWYEVEQWCQLGA